MRKRTITHISKTLCWGLFTWLPLIGYLATLLGHGDNVTLTDYFGQFVATGNPVYTSLVDVFGNLSDLLPFATSPDVANGAIALLSWVITATFARLIVEFVLFVPKYICKFIEGVVYDEE